MIKAISGKSFNELFYKGHSFYKLLNLTKKHHNFQYQTSALNVDHIPLSTCQCAAGGLYFTYDQYWPDWIRSEHYWIATVLILDDANVIVESHHKAKADKFVLLEPTKLTDFMKPLTEYYCAYILRNQYVFLFVPETHKTEKFIISALQCNGDIIRYVVNPTTEMQMMSIEKNPKNIMYIENPAETVQLSVVERNANNIQYIDKPTMAVQKRAVMKSPHSIHYIRKPCAEAVKIIDDWKKICNNVSYTKKTRLIWLRPNGLAEHCGYFLYYLSSM